MTVGELQSGVAGALAALVGGSPIGMAIGAGKALLGIERRSDPGSAYCYLFAAHRQLAR